MAEVKKPVAVAPKADEKKAEPVAVKAEPVAEKKAAVKKAVAAKKTVKKAAAVQTKVAAKKTVKKAVAVQKAATVQTKVAAKKAAVKTKVAAKKAAKKVDTKTKMVVQFDGADLFDTEALKARAIKDYKKATKSDAKKMDIYVNVNEKMVYYVVDDFNGSFEV